MSTDKDRMDRVRQVYDAEQQQAQQAAAQDSIHRTQEAAARKADFLREQVFIAAAFC